jgi:hypothetical protein
LALFVPILCLEWRGLGPRVIDPAQDLGEQGVRHRYLGHRIHQHFRAPVRRVLAAIHYVGFGVRFRRMRRILQ